MFSIHLSVFIYLLHQTLASSSLGQSQLVLSSDEGYSSTSTCSGDLPTSCHLPSSKGPLNTCCTNSPGGQILLTQFWDFHPATGPSDSWTIHGLWPDNCDGSYDASCDSERSYTNITQILQQGGGQQALDVMSHYWKDQRGNDEKFWQHEWGKHGTCISTLEPKCFGESYTPQSEVVAFFNRTVDLFQALPTYKWLAEADPPIVPSTSVTYTLAQLQAVANKHFGQDAVWNCRGHSLNEVWWHFNTVGTVSEGKFVPAKPVGPLSTCPQSGIQYFPKSGGGGGGGGRTPHHPNHPSHPPSHPSPPSDKHFIHVIDTSTGRRNGCLIGTGAWYTTGTCAGFTIMTSKDDDILEVRSRKGACAFRPDGSLSCGRGIESKGFSYNATYLLHDGQQVFHADGVPSGRTKMKVRKGDGLTTIMLEVAAAA
ncbi:ribonuclease T2-like protein [Melampsora americana]|nr:ribonuclease T2-like protein [Melampsora americana]